METVKNQGRQDIKDKWKEIEDYFVDVINKQSGNETIQWIKPTEHLSYQVPKKPFEITEEDFNKTILDYILFENKIDNKDFVEELLDTVLYSSMIVEDLNNFDIKINKGDKNVQD